MSNRSFVLTLLLGLLLATGAVVTSKAASTTTAATAQTAVSDSAAGDVVSPGDQSSSLSCNETICHTTVDCSLGTTSCGVCVIPPGSFFGHCVLKK
jgi:hypothetical protein